jgi:uncharacterized protein (TIGR00255 family)
MTGFGKETLLLPAKKITIEVKSLNSKSLDLNLRIPPMYREKEMALRNLIAAHANRGKIDFALYAEITGPEDVPRINKAVVSGYLRQIEAIKLAESVAGDSLSVAMRLPDVVSADKDEVDATEWEAIEQAVTSALEKLHAFRLDEGSKLEEDLRLRIGHIENLMVEVAPFEEERVHNLRERIEKNLKQLAEKPEPNRLEQEFIFYLEKLDITEEKVRLKTHLDYFREIMLTETLNGRKLGFVTQEIGREINTLGSKANHGSIQKIVVRMKDELEKIKEQLLNVL